MPEKDPTTYPLITYTWVLLLSSWGGMVSWLRKRKRGIARLQLCILQDGMERSVRPRAVFAPALQRSPGGFPGSHGHGQPPTGSVCPSR